MCARVNTPDDAVRMPSFGRWLLVWSAVVVLAPCAVGVAQDVNVPAEPVAIDGGVRPAEDAGGPYVAEATGNDVFIRSGAGTNFYQCGKLYKGDRVQVVREEQGWSCIIPPPGCFSWIPMQYVSINLDNPTMGIVTGDNVRIYAGSDYVEPMHSTSEQVKLHRRGGVRLLGEEKDDYYKIAPPDGAYLWVSSQYLQRVQADIKRPPVGIEATAPRPSEGPQTPPAPGTESEFLDAYYALDKLLKAELKKPVAEQKYGEIKEKLESLTQSEAAGKAARYAEFTLKQVERFELACTVAKEIDLQSKALTQVTEKIDEARQARLAQVQNLGRFAVIGKLEKSSLYDTADELKRYRILDESGKTLCYVAPGGATVGQDLSTLIGKKVGLVGEIRAHEATARAFVRFTEIVSLE